MPDEIEDLLHRLLGDDGTLTAAIIEQANEVATTTRDRQIVAVAAARISGNDQLVDDLVRDHLLDHPGSPLARWTTAQRSLRPSPLETHR